MSVQFTLVNLSEGPSQAFSHYGVVSLQGTEAISYLQGQITANIGTQSSEHWQWGGHADPKGRLWSAFRMLKTGAGIALVQEKHLIPAHLAELKKYGVFAKVEIEDSSENTRVFGLMGPAAGEWLSQLIDTDTEQISQGDLFELEQGKALVVSPSGEEIRVMLVLRSDAPQYQALLEQSDPAGHAKWAEAEMRDGNPGFPTEQIQQLLPQMINLDGVGGIDYEKGCYLGQEMVARAKFRGANKRRMFVLTGQGELPDDTTLELALESSWKRTGQVLAGIQSHDDRIWLQAVLPKDLAPDTIFRFKHAPDTQLSISKLPYELED